MKVNRFFFPVKLAGVFFIASLCATHANAQYLRTSYFMENTHFRNQLNPAITPNRGFINLPVVGGINAAVGSTSLGYQDVMDILDNGSDFYKTQDFMNRLDNNNVLNMSSNINLLSAGWYKGQNFWSFNIGLRMDLGAKVTKSMFNFLNEVDEMQKNWNNQEFDIQGQELNIQSYVEVGVGFARPINDRLSVGGRLKALLGVGNMEMKVRRAYMKANLPTEQRINEIQNMKFTQQNWYQEVSALKTELEGYHALLDVDATLNSSFKGLDLEENDKGYVDDMDFDSGNMGLAGYGLGIDLGASYKILDNLTVSAAVLDLGFMSWSKGSTQTGTASGNINLQGSDYVKRFEGVTTEEQAQQVLNDFANEAQDYLNSVSDGDIMNYDMLKLETKDADKSRKSALAATIVLGGEYGFFENKLAVGVLSTTRFLKPETKTELTFSANYRPKSWLNATFSYSPIMASGKSFGLGLGLGPVFIGTDYMFLGKNSNSVNAFFGVSIPLGKKKADKES